MEADGVYEELEVWLWYDGVYEELEVWLWYDGV